MPRKPTTAARGQNAELPLGEAVYRRIRRAIAEGQYQPGDRLREPDIVGWLGVSRTPVREAMRRLQQDGLLVATEHGLMVPQLDREQVQELYEVRQILEGAAARLAAQRATDDEIAVLVHLVEQEEAADENLAARIALNHNFHNALFGAAHNRFLIKSLRTLWDVFWTATGSPLSFPGRLKTSLAEHQAIIRALQDRDPEAAETALRNHTREAQKIRLVVLGTAASRDRFD
jgi:DNA-binding GntR family transcriptional regulator